MALDRQIIEKKDFPVGRRGYDPGAVDAHLAYVAEEVQALQRAAPAESLAAVAAEQVRSIVEAAERSAGEIRRQAEEDARVAREAADLELRTAQEQAGGQARAYVDGVAEAASVLLQRVNALEAEVGGLVEHLRGGVERLHADVGLLQGELAGVRAAASAGRPAPVAEETERPPASPALAETEGGPEPRAQPEPPPASVSVANGAGEDDPEGARLVALNMALNGSSREETDRYLAEHFALEDRTTLLDEVYETVQG